jgi:hypothetical protein
VLGVLPQPVLKAFILWRERILHIDDDPRWSHRRLKND